VWAPAARAQEPTKNRLKNNFYSQPAQGCAGVSSTGHSCLGIARAQSLFIKREAV